ncbi:uncharacterized protein LY89DRAFT_692743 [Mollisia scopiformis]|uniref:ATPase AAA-type core domain-containing protein n=1 Tax=Mollisia scopiformis TaxID=149040 RepID=A0A194XUL2_MOLSC|nr:uncharacterized protein LY89DRAFT_692743 [Mollisia scopiformis]KUJ23826.1 hypothetical protein LY89DRAFT_692743 [Mollisia scopiformis]
MTVVGRNSHHLYAADFIEGKGEGQIILLHGPPGDPIRSQKPIVDIRAETVAEFTERPLLSLSVSDVGTTPQFVENNLKFWMKKARRWGAILLIDEADVYLEERTAQDFQCNSLVSVFLNNLEYYQGILFLTTNRVGVMWYPGFDDQIRVKVWNSMIARLQRDRKDISIPYVLTKYIEKDEDLQRVEWNGREIRNVPANVFDYGLSNSCALAEYQASEEKSTEIELKIDYLDKVVKMSRRFKKYLSEMPDGNIAKKAWQYGKRNDRFKDT